MQQPTQDGLERFRKLARLIPGGMAFGRWLHRVLSPHQRSITSTKRAHREALFQPFPTTLDERYPELFDALQDRLNHIANPRLLSFGCASGEEIRALRRRFPTALLTGIDANRHAIHKARRADKSRLSDYRVDTAPADGDQFHAILAMAVFRHGDIDKTRPDNCEAILEFSKFQTWIAKLDACLEPGGYLAIWHANFRFSDTAAFSRYEADTLLAPQMSQATLYGPDNRRIDDPAPLALIYRKL
ncbi:MAG: methyltransferase domain-containing protein [Novosphingobium sp.]|nr:methyltransferase domain-containing protein [Novosphingobium sp.]